MNREQRQDRAARRRAIEESIGALAARQHGVVTRAQLLDLGIRAGAIRRRADGGRLTRLHAGVYIVGPVRTPQAALMAAVLACGPRALLSHNSAAALYGIGDTPDSDAPVDVIVPLPFDRARPGIRVRRVRRLDDDESAAHDGIPITSPLRTLVDLGTVLHEHQLERAISRAERERLVSPESLATIPARWHGHPGARRLRRVLARLGGPSLTRSEAERRFLDLVRRAHLPAPRANVDLSGFEIDFLWPDHRVAVEVDGYRYHASRARFEADRRRNTRLAALGIQVVSLTWRQIVDDEVATAVQLGQVLMRAGGR